MSAVITLRPLQPGEGHHCEAILRDLPDWFGIEESLLMYTRNSERLPTWIAWEGADAVGFITLERHFEHAAEIHCIAVKRSWHARGVGAMMIAHAEAWCRERGVEYLQVKTMGPSRPCEFYARTTTFYERVGFRPLEEMKTLWGKIPALVMVKRVG